LLGIMQQQMINILIDPGSTNSFISQSLVDKLHHLVSVSVRVIDGSSMHCLTVVSQAVWSIQHYEFT
jgi:predicted ATP-grasp superfamily ATP-dependent carboligase